MARPSEPTRRALAEPQHARIDAAIGPATLAVHVTVSPAALLAIGGMIGIILLGSAAIVWTARRAVARGGRAA